MLIGANEGGAGGQGRSNSNAKAARIGCPHYTNAEESMNILVTYSGATTNNLYWGGGTGVMNGATSHHFYTAANNTTTGGTERLQINSSGDYLLLGGTLRIKNSANNAQHGAIYGDSTSFHVNAGGILKLYSGGGERIRIDTAGSVRLLDFSTAVDSDADDFVVGTTNSGINRGMTILSHTGADARICFATASDPDEGMIKYSHGSDVMQFFVNAAERMRIENLCDRDWETNSSVCTSMT